MHDMQNEDDAWGLGQPGLDLHKKQDYLLMHLAVRIQLFASKAHNNACQDHCQHNPREQHMLNTILATNSSYQVGKTLDGACE
jgi:hypothetical protein